jgi:Spy/CpxP family protein refolding chaperone
MKKLMNSLLIVALVLVFSGTALAQGRGERGPEFGLPHHQWWLNPQIVKELKLSDKQVDEITQISRDSRKEMVTIHSQTELVMIDLESALDAEKVDLKQAQALISKMADLRSQIGKKRMESMLEIRNVLTREQYLKLKEKRMEKRKSRRSKLGDALKQRPKAS